MRMIKSQRLIGWLKKPLQKGISLCRQPSAVLKSSIALVLVFGMLAGCSFGSSPENVRVAEVTRSIFYAPLYAGLEKGYFEEEGIEIDLTTTWGGDKTMTALLSDGADIALVGSETSIYVHSQGPTDPVINFAMLTQTDGTFLLSREDKSFSWDDLKGTTFLGQREGGMPQMVGEYVLKENGIDPDNDLNLIQNIDFANIANAFSSGTGDYVQLFEPQATLFEQEGIGHVVASFGTESGNLPYTAFMAKESYLQENEETAHAFTRALYRAQQWVYDASAEEVASTIAPYFEDTSEDIIADAVERYRDQESYAKTPVLPPSAWEHLQTVMDEANQLPAKVEYETLVNNKFAKEAESSVD